MGFLKALFISLFAIFLPIKMVLLSAFILTIADMASGILAAIKQKQPITSKGLGRTILKLFIYEFVLMMGFLADRYLFQGAIPVVKILGGIIGATEMTSILENADILSGNTLFANIVTMLQSKSNKNLGDK